MIQWCAFGARDLDCISHLCALHLDKDEYIHLGWLSGREKDTQLLGTASKFLLFLLNVFFFYG